MMRYRRGYWDLRSRAIRKENPCLCMCGMVFRLLPKSTKARGPAGGNAGNLGPVQASFFVGIVDPSAASVLLLAFRLDETPP